MNCITLNMCGLGEDHKVNWILRLKNRHKILFFGIQQTQMSNAEEINVAGCWGSNEFEHDGVNAVGRSGGLLSIWVRSSFRFLTLSKLDTLLLFREIGLAFHPRSILIIFMVLSKSLTKLNCGMTCLQLKITKLELGFS